MDLAPHSRRTSYETVALVSAAVLLAALVITTARILLVLFAGLLLAIVLQALARGVSKVSRLPYWAALALVVLIGVALTAVALTSTLPRLAEQLRAVGAQLPAPVGQELASLERALGGKTRSFAQIDLRRFVPEDGAGKALLSAVGGSIAVLSASIVVFFIGVYAAAQPKLYVRAIFSVIPPRLRKQALRALRSAHSNLLRWLLGRLVAMVFVGITTSVAFQLLGLSFSVTLGMFAGLLTFIEYAGAVISAIPPLIVAFSKGPTTALWVLAIFTVLHLIEGYVLTPVLARATVRLPPAFTLATQVLFAVLVGPLGLTFSTPLLVVAVAGLRGFRARANPLRRSGPSRSHARPLR